MIAVSCTGPDPAADEPTDPSTSQRLATTDSIVGTAGTTIAATPTPPTSAAATKSTPPITLGADDLTFHAGTDTIVVAHAPAPWEPFPNADLGMRRDLGTAEWVGISFWAPLHIATDSCEWTDNWATPGESVAQLADALVAVSERQATTPVPVTVGGYDGLYLEWSLPADLDVATCDRGTTMAWTGAPGRRRSYDIPGAIDRIWILDVEGDRILIDAISLPVEQAVIRERTDEVIESLRFAAND